MCTNIAQGEGDLEEVDTKKYATSMHSETSRSSRRSFETLCFTFTTPQHCEEAWEWFDKCSVDTNTDSKYEGETRFYLILNLMVAVQRHTISAEAAMGVACITMTEDRQDMDTSFAALMVNEIM